MKRPVSQPSSEYAAALLFGFYFEESPYYHLLLEIGDLKVVGDPKYMKFKLQHIHYLPTELKAGVLYVSEEFGK